MKECVECGKTLGFIEGYRHPTMGKDYLLCSCCFDNVSASVEKWSKFISQYIDFFKKKSALIKDTQKIGENITEKIKNTQNKGNNLWTHNINQNTNEDLNNVHEHNSDILTIH